MRANFISKAKLSDEELDQILAYVDKHYEGKFNFTNALKMLYRTPNEWEQPEWYDKAVIAYLVVVGGLYIWLGGDGIWIL